MTETAPPFIELTAAPITLRRGKVLLEKPAVQPRGPKGPTQNKNQTTTVIPATVTVIAYSS
jgi:hypothetical protein